MEDLLDHAPCGFVSFGDDGIVAKVNATLAEMLGMDRADLVRRHIDALFTAPSRFPCFSTALAASAAEVTSP
jgi:sigma-B regulation protein RsbU (phosphoserine phosphatase)